MTLPISSGVIFASLYCREKSIGQGFGQQRCVSLLRFVDERSVLGNDVAKQVDEACVFQSFR